MVVGHDWGGSVAWTLAMNHPEVVDRLVILNAAHPRKLNEGLRNPRQLLRSWYFFYFQTPKLPERRARRCEQRRREDRGADRGVQQCGRGGELVDAVVGSPAEVLSTDRRMTCSIEGIPAAVMVVDGPPRYCGTYL